MKQLESFVGKDITIIENFTEKTNWDYIGVNIDEADNYFDSVRMSYYNYYRWGYDYKYEEQSAIAWLQCAVYRTMDKLESVTLQMQRELYQTILNSISANGYKLINTEMGETITKTYQKGRYTLYMKKINGDEGLAYKLILKYKLESK